MLFCPATNCCCGTTAAGAWKPVHVGRFLGGLMSTVELLSSSFKGSMVFSLKLLFSWDDCLFCGALGILCRERLSQRARGWPNVR
jgi:hypothetical protein